MTKKQYINKRKEVKKKTLEIEADKVSATTRQSAMKIDFAKLQNLMLQTISKTSSKTYTQYTKEQLRSYITNPSSNLDNIREISAFLYRNSMIYKNLLSYYSNMPMYSYNVTYQPKDFLTAATMTQKDFLKKYQEVLQRTEIMQLRNEMPSVTLEALRDGASFNFIYDDGKSFFLHHLPTKYTKIIGKVDGVYELVFDATYFDTYKEFIGKGNNTAEIDNDGLWDKVFIDGYETYKAQGNNYKWFRLPIERTFTVISPGSDPTLPLPRFLPIFQSLLDLLDVEALIRNKQELQNYVLLVSKLPLFSNSQETNDFAIDADVAQGFQDMLEQTLPEAVGATLAPFEIEPIFFNNQDNSKDTDDLAKASHNLFTNSGVSEVAFNSEASNSSGVLAGIKTDELLAFEMLEQMTRNLNYYIQQNIDENFVFAFHPITYFSKTDYENSLLSRMALGEPVRMDAATLAKTPYKVMCDTYLQKALNLEELWKAPQSTYTTTADDISEESGRPKEEDSEISDSGDDSRANDDAQVAKDTKAIKE